MEKRYQLKQRKLNIYLTVIISSRISVLSRDIITMLQIGPTWSASSSCETTIGQRYKVLPSNGFFSCHTACRTVCRIIVSLPLSLCVYLCIRPSHCPSGKDQRRAAV